jgi:SAM-dependent methyltransferase
VGTAAGFTLLGFRERGWRVFGLEPNPRMAALARERFALAVSTDTVESFRADDGPYDLVVMLQVIAHCVDPLAAGRRVAELLRPDGLWLVETWDRESWTARIFGRRWHEYSPPSVLHWFSRRGMRTLAGELGFRPVATGRPRRRIRGRHARSLLRHAFDGSLLAPLARGPLRLIPENMSIPYPGTDLFWALFRKEARP